ncbi:uncharacterized protein [Musca autumnalis]
MAAKRSRASSEQIRYLVDFMTNNKDLASGKFAKMNGKLESKKKWEELSVSLNSLGGADKSPDQWHTVWRDVKSRTSQKCRESKRQQALTGNREVNEEPMTDIEMRVVEKIGNAYMEGDESVKENVPMEEELQLLLESGEEIGNDISQKSITSNESAQSLKRKEKRLKRKREERDEVQSKFLDIANKQAESLKMLAECNAANTESNKMMAEALKTMGEGLKAAAESLNNISNAPNNMFNYN